MTDEEIIELAEKTRKEKYCKFCEEPAIYDCSNECKCPILYFEDCHTTCGDTIYEQGFLDGFKEAMIKFQEEIKRLYAQNEKDYEDYNDDNIYGGYTHALEHMETFINS